MEDCQWGARYIIVNPTVINTYGSPFFNLNFCCVGKKKYPARYRVWCPRS